MAQSTFYRYQLQKPSFIVMLGLVVFTVLFVLLGRWQLHRYDEKKIMAQMLHLRSTNEPLTLVALLKKTDPGFYRIRLSGYYDNAHSFLLDNKIENGQVGYHVITPLITLDHHTVLVNRGFIPLRDRSRVLLPQISAVKGEQRLEGVVKSLDQNDFALKNHAMEIGRWPVRMQIVDVVSIQALLGQPVVPFIVLLNPNAPNGFIRHWQWIMIPASKHLGYALQWFSFAVILWAIFFVIHVKRKSI